MRYHLRWENRPDPANTGWYLYEEPVPHTAWARGTIDIVYDRPATPERPGKEDAMPHPDTVWTPEKRSAQAALKARLVQAIAQSDGAELDDIIVVLTEQLVFWQQTLFARLQHPRED